jgi:Tfp pilus assembly ATPase PilU
LICGSTGSGKSVSIISIVEYAKIIGFDEIVIFDPKFEFIKYRSSNIQVYNDIEEIEQVMENQVVRMNELVKTGVSKKTLIIFDEFADALSASKKGNELNVYEDVQVGLFANGNVKTKREKVEVKKSLEENLKILLQKGRSSGYRIIAATQRASTKIITGDAKVNFPVQICFRVPKEIDSKVVLDEVGAESLSGKGDGLIKSPEYSGVIRFQSFIKKD